MGGNPYISPLVRCAGPNCTHMKGDSNHWHIAVVDDPPTMLILYEWDYSLLQTVPEALPLCGEQCAIKIVSKFMSDQKSKSVTASVMVATNTTETEKENPL